MPTSWEINNKSTNSGTRWENASNAWEDESAIFLENPWTIISGTKVQTNTSWSINTKTQVQTATET